MLATARKLTRSAFRPRQAELKRAVSTVYYAMFGFLAQECADLFIGTGAARKYPSWSQVYRALEHGPAKTACTRTAKLNFPPEIVQFATLFIAAQEQRHNADYDPSARFTRAEVITLIDNAEQAIKDFKKANRQDRLAFATLVLLKWR